MRDDQALDRLAGLVLEDGRHWGSAATPEQWSDARAVLTGEQPYHFLTRARGYSKTTDLAGIALAAMLTQLPERSSCYALASDRDQGRLLADAAEGLIIRTPALPGAFNVEQWKIAATRSGTTLEILAADAPGAWGLRPALVIADELAQWTETSQGSVRWHLLSRPENGRADLRPCAGCGATTPVAGAPSQSAAVAFQRDRRGREHP